MWTGLSLNAMGREPEDRVDRAENAMGREPEDRVDRAELECHGEGARGPCGQG